MSFSTRIITLLLLLTLAVFAADCETHWSDTVNVRVVSQDFTLIEGAEVSVTYQLDRTTAKGYHTATGTTNESGLVSFRISNLEILEEHLDCDVDIVVHYDEQTAERTVTATRHTHPVDMVIEAHPLTVRVVDQDNDPIRDAEVFVNGRRQVTDVVGQAHFTVGEGTVFILAKYDIGKAETEIEVTQALVHTMGIAFYPLRVRAIDEQGNTLPITVTVENQTYTTEDQLELLQVARARPEVTVQYQNIEKNVDVDLALQSDYTVVFDLTPPRIADIRQVVSVSLDRLRLSMGIVDEGRHASQLAGDGIVLSYRYDAGEWQEVRVYRVAQNQYGADLPRPPEARLLFFSVEAVDGEGNRAVMDGHMELEALSTNQTTPNGDQPPEEPPEETGLPLVPIVGLGAIAIAIYLVYRFKLSKGGDS